MVKQSVVGGLRAELAGECGGIATFASVADSPQRRARSAMHRRRIRPGLIALLTCQLGILPVLAGSASTAHAAQFETACDVLLMDFECARYRQRLDAAGSDAERGRIIAEYSTMLAERRRYCPVSEKGVPLKSAYYSAKR